MRNKGVAKFAAAALVAASVAAMTTATAAATDSIKVFGQQQTIDDVATGGPLIGYTVDGLGPSSDVVPYPVAGRLYAADVTVNAFGTWATPVIPRLNARAQNGQGYPSLSNVFTPQSLQGNAVPPGGSSSGKVYFDVVGVDPNSVVYNDGIRDILAWIPSA